MNPSLPVEIDIVILCAMQTANEKKRKEDGKRSRGEKEIVMDMLFKAFEKHQYYTIQDLGKVTKQPIVSTAPVFL